MQHSIPEALKIVVLIISTLAMAAGRLPAGEPAAKGKREPIGEVFGKPVYRDEIRTEKGTNLGSELRRLFAGPVLEQYRKEHQDVVTPTKAEIEAAKAYFDRKHWERIADKEADLRFELKQIDEQMARRDLAPETRKKLEIRSQSIQAQLKPPGEFFARFVLDNWKLQRHLYDKFGGGRILWQQGGLEAFDAMHAWLESEEKSGHFKITDAELRTAFYEYWTTMKHGPFLTSDPQRIRKEFLAPEWVAKKP